ncbi:phospholipase D-like domain-containing protein [Nonomuraea montanisoli]|nr:hypothetical protein [Nonomuraea montanisoli]
MNPWEIRQFVEWGAQGASGRAWFGRGVLDGLAATLDEHHYGTHEDLIPGVIGCVPWFDNRAISQRLQKDPCCIVVDKPAPKRRLGLAAQELAARGWGINTHAISHLYDLMPFDSWGDEPVSPYEELGVTVGPVRMAGFRGTSPTLHCKILVLGVLVEDYEECTGEEFQPRSVWLGSANWTEASARGHLEFGLVSKDRQLVRSAYEFVTRVIAISEPLTSTSVRPNPELAPVEYEDEELADIMRRLRAYEEKEDRSNGRQI